MPSPGPPRGTGHDRDPLRIGTRVVVRYRLPEGSQPALTDVVGEVVGVDAQSVAVAARTGPVQVARAAIVAVKAVPPRPTRPGPPYRTVGIGDLGRIMASGWRAMETAHLGEWRLGASRGFTGRANSVLPYGDPGVLLGEAVGFAEQWYGARGLPAKVQLALPVGGVPDDDGLGSLLLRRGYGAAHRTLVLTAPTAGVPTFLPPDDDVVVEAEAALTSDWLAVYALQRALVPGATAAVLAGADEPLFLTARAPDCTAAAVARVTLHPGWAGLSALWVAPARRRTGIARRLTHAFADLAREHSAASLFLQVEADNTPARALYESLGFTAHHEYVYLTHP